MKKSVLTCIILLYSASMMFSQSIPLDSLYLGQTTPGDSAIIFAPGTISLQSRRETKIVFSPNNQECLIGIGQNNTFRILYSDFYSGYWTTPVPAYFISNPWPIEPFFSPDSLHVFLTTNANIYRSGRVNQLWNAPVIVGQPISTNQEEYHPTTALNGTLYFCSNRDNPGGYDIYRSLSENGNYTTVEKLDSLINRHTSGQNGAYDPYIAPDESYLIFTSTRPDGYGKGDQYISYFKNGRWTNPKNLGPSINTNAIEYGSWISPDGKYYFFSRPAGWGPNVAADIFWIKIDELIDSLRYTNFVPYLRNLIPCQTAYIGYLFNFTVPDSTFTDDDGNNTLTYQANMTNGNPLPQWLAFDTATAAFSGTPAITDTLDISITATDDSGEIVSTPCKIIVKDRTGIDHRQDRSVKIFPNPTTGPVTISVNSMPVRTAVAEICNTHGDIIQTNTFKNDINLDLTGRPKGVYIVRLLIDREVIIDKICVQ